MAWCKRRRVIEARAYPDSIATYYAFIHKMNYLTAYQLH